MRSTVPSVELRLLLFVFMTPASPVIDQPENRSFVT
jgi:hypothetical protein